jgi:hypothetical protein
MNNLIAGLTQHIPPKHKQFVRYYGVYSSKDKKEGCRRRMPFEIWVQSKTQKES